MQNGQQGQQWITDQVTHCIAADPNYDPADSISWQGHCRRDGMIVGPGKLVFLNKGRVLETIDGAFVDGMPKVGRVVATWSDGAKYEGEQLGFLFDGTGKFVSAKGETFNGEWKLGVLNGKASVTWANGDHYEGTWKNGKSDGQGVEVWADGRRYEGEWRDGVPVGNVQADSTNMAQVPTATGPDADGSVHGAPAVAATQNPTPPAVKAASFIAPVANTGAASVAPPVAKAVAMGSQSGQVPNTFLPLRSLMGTQLLAVDGATLALRVTNTGFRRTLALSNGILQEVEFAFVNGPIGTLSSEERAIGVFRARSGELDIDYADGTTESLGDTGDGGLFDRARTVDGRTMCTAWYPQDHVFSNAEKKAAVQEFANRLGVSVAAPTGKHAAHAPEATCGGAFIAAGDQRRPSDAANPGTAQPDVSRPAGQRAALEVQIPPPAARDAAVAVNTSAVHLVDNPAASALPAPRLEQASFTPGAASAPVSAVPAGLQSATRPGASDCLSVTSNGEYWGFQNRCAKSVQFAYCEMSAGNPLTACTHTSVSGSVAANSFSALVSDRSLSEKSVDHEFRWMACEGGAGEVVPHLDKFDPPSGRCERAVPASE